MGNDNCLLCPGLNLYDLGIWLYYIVNETKRHCPLVSPSQHYGLTRQSLSGYTDVHLQTNGTEPVVTINLVRILTFLLITANTRQKWMTARSSRVNHRQNKGLEVPLSCYLIGQRPERKVVGVLYNVYNLDKLQERFAIDFMPSKPRFWAGGWRFATAMIFKDVTGDWSKGCVFGITNVTYIWVTGRLHER